MDLLKLEQIIKDRVKNPINDSYTNELLAKGSNKIAQKVGEEATEVIVAALAEGKSELICESADLLYHLLVLLADKQVSLDEIYNELAKRHGNS